MTTLSTPPIQPDQSLDPLLQQVLNAPVPQNSNAGNLDGIINLITGFMNDNRSAEDVLGVAAQINVRNAQATARNAVLAQQAYQGKLDAGTATRAANNRDKESRQRQVAAAMALKFQGRKAEAGLAQSAAATEASKASTKSSLASTKLTDEQTRGLKAENDEIKRRLKQVNPFDTDIMNLYREADKIKDEMLQSMFLKNGAQIISSKNDAAGTKALSLITIADYVEVQFSNPKNSELVLNADGEQERVLTERGQKILGTKLAASLGNPNTFDEIMSYFEGEGIDPVIGISTYLKAREEDDLFDIDIDLVAETFKVYKKMGGKRKVSGTFITPKPIPSSIMQSIHRLQKMTAGVAQNVRQQGGGPLDVAGGIVGNLTQPLVGLIPSANSQLSPQTEKNLKDFEAIFGKPQ